MTTQQRFEEWLGFEIDLPECTVLPIGIWWHKFEERKTFSYLYQHMEDVQFDSIPGLKENIADFLHHDRDELRVELLLKTMAYSSDAKFDDDAPPYCQALVSIPLGTLRKAIRAAQENNFDWVVIEPDDVQLFTNDWEDIDFGRYGNNNQLFVRSRHNPRVELRMTHKDNPDCYLKFDNV